MLSWWLIPIVIHYTASSSETLNERQRINELIDELEMLEETLERLMLIEENSLIAVSVPVFIQVRTLGYRTLTAYNSVPEQTDSTPCISASGMNVCETSRNIVATNELPFGTELFIEGEIWEVQDRMNKKYKNGEIDLLMDSYEDAKNWGIQTKLVELIL